jgi:hypothetical protein
VFRSTILAIVLTVAVSPAVRLICEAGCDPQVAAASGCHGSHHGTTTSVSALDNCRAEPLLAVTPARGDTRGAVAPRGEQPAVLGATGYTAAGRLSLDIRYFRSGSLPVQRRPLTPILRI